MNIDLNNIAQNPLESTTIHDYKCLWKDLTTLPKIKCFLWQCSLNKINCKLNLFKKKIIISPLCDICDLEEDALHIPRNCKTSWDFWLPYHPFTQKFILDFHNINNIFTWLCLNCAETNKLHNQTPWNIFFSFACWHLWIRRNVRLHQPTEVAKNNVIHHNLHMLVTEFFIMGHVTQNPTKTIEPLYISWMPPPLILTPNLTQIALLSLTLEKVL